MSERKNVSRRDFMKASAVGAGVVSAIPTFSSESVSPKRCATDRVSLLQTGIKMSRIAMGTGSNGYDKVSDQTKLGQPLFTKMMKHAFESGLNFFDMADLYGSHPYMKNAFKEIPRDESVVLSKIWFRSGGVMKGASSAYPEVERFRQEIGTDYLDIVLIHCVTTPRWVDEQKQIRDELADLKSKGIVRVHGCSCHNLEALKVAAEDPWADVILARINDKQKRMDGAPDDVSKALKTARSNGKHVIGMKIFGCGDLTDVESRNASLDFVLKNELVDTMTIGSTKLEHVDDNIERVTTYLNV